MVTSPYKWKILERDVQSLLNAVFVAKQSPPILNILGLTQPARAGLELTISWMLSESTTTKLPQLVSPVTGLQIYTYNWHLRLLAVRVLLLATPTATRDLILSVRLLILISECRALDKGQSLSNLTRAATAGLELTILEIIIYKSQVV
jgi:hypothetical protein